jgi:single-strand DNA-binding protein
MIAGNLTRDPELRVLSDNAAVCNFAIAINHRYKNSAGEVQQEATFVDVEAWGQTGGIVAQYFKKGSPIYISGRLKLDSWTDTDGQKRQRLKVQASAVQFVEAKRESAEPVEEVNRDTGEVTRRTVAKAAGKAGGK